MDYTIISWLATLSFAVAIYFTYKLSSETKGEKYWIFFLIAAITMGLHHGAVIPWQFGLINDTVKTIVEEIGEIVGALALAYASYGLYKSMREIRIKVSK